LLFGFDGINGARLRHISLRRIPYFERMDGDSGKAWPIAVLDGYQDVQAGFTAKEWTISPAPFV